MKVDQEVKEGDALFTYDMSQAQLDLEKPSWSWTT